VLHIRKEQMEVFDAYMLELFVEKMLVHVREVFPEQTKDKSKDELRALVEDGIKRASAYDINEERQVALLIDLMIGIGRDFEKRKPWIERILVSEEFDQHEKMNLIYKRLEAASA